jgi:hypothetical protein
MYFKQGDPKMTMIAFVPMAIEVGQVLGENRIVIPFLQGLDFEQSQRTLKIRLQEWHARNNNFISKTERFYGSVKNIQPEFNADKVLTLYAEYLQLNFWTQPGKRRGEKKKIIVAIHSAMRYGKRRDAEFPAVLLDMAKTRKWFDVL